MSDGYNRPPRFTDSKNVRAEGRFSVSSSMSGAGISSDRSVSKERHESHLDCWISDFVIAPKNNYNLTAFKFLIYKFIATTILNL